LYDARSRGAESYSQLAKEIMGHHGSGTTGETAAVAEPAAIEDQKQAQEKQAVNSPRWKRWIKERNKLTTIDLSNR
jgi:hypothetical protein